MWNGRASGFLTPGWPYLPRYLVGLSLGFPLFLYLRELQRERPA